MSKTVLYTAQSKKPSMLICRSGSIKRVELKERMLIGRQTQSNRVDLDLREKFVSRDHFELTLQKGEADAEVHSKAYGLMCNGRLYRAGDRVHLRDGDVLQIRNGALGVEEEVITLVYTTDYPDEFESIKVELTQNTAEINIGRIVHQGIGIDNEAVSANHASFFIAGKGWAVMDHHSTNGVFLNGIRLNGPNYLKKGDAVRIANMYFIYTGNNILYTGIGQVSSQKKESSSDSLSINIVERSVWQRTKKLMLLQNINMTIEPGEMVLILGGSGAGKTTFINAVMGYEKADGKIMHGETDIYEDFESMKYKIGFVPQQDLLRGNDTVYSTLKNAADMKMYKSLKKVEREKRIEKTLDTLGLRREKDSLVSKLSGGQRKRLSIAVEYIADPSLFFLDEPDSGLDGIMAKTLMRNLRSIADEGKIVMVISHGPDRAADLFDKVIVLAKSTKDNCGHLAFFGDVSKALTFFKAKTLEDIVQRINRQDEGGDGMADYYIEQYEGE